MKKIIQFFDKLEDKIRRLLSRQPLWYAFIGGIGIVLFWRGVWHTADYISNEVLAISSSGRLSQSLSGLFLLDGILSIVAGSIMLLMTGVFVSSFIGNEVILTGLKGEKKLAEKTKGEIETEFEKMKKMEKEIKNISRKISKIQNNLEEK